MDRLQESLGEEFDIVRPLGQGSVAEVFLARERALDRPVAIKLLRRMVASHEVARKRFVREARLAARIHHPNVVSVYRVGELSEDGTPYLVLEYIDGRTFADILEATGPLEEDEVRRALVEVCKALEVAHQAGVIHRDVRPGNIMLTRDGGRIVLADFGLAAILETGTEIVTRLTLMGEVLGDAHYAAPEQVVGDPVQPGSDIYALAVTAYELLTGDGPYPGSTRSADLARSHVGGEPTPIRRIRATVSPALEDILLRCLHKRPERRPSAALIRKQVEAGTEAAPAVVPAGALDSFLAELKRRHVYKVGAAYGAFILVVLAFVDAALPALPFPIPEWTDTAIVTATLAGLPVALILGWFYDVTSRGVELTRPASEHTPRSIRLLQFAGVALTLLVAALVGWLVLT